MSDFPARRIRSLHLQAPSADLVRRGAILLEDALHTASLPEGGAGRLLVIRSLYVGKIRGSQSPSSLALNVERALWRLSASAIHAESSGAENHQAVYFRDALEACVALARRLARRESVAAWFWPLAVRAWRREMPRDEALRTLLGVAMRTELGAAGGALMLRELYESGAADQMLAALDWQDGGALLRWLGLAEETRPGLAEMLFAPPPPASVQAQMVRWLPLLRRWAEHWGATDARSRWLAATALLAENPSRQIDPHWSSVAWQLINLACAPKLPPTALQTSQAGETNLIAEEAPPERAEEAPPVRDDAIGSQKSERNQPALGETIPSQHSDRTAGLASDAVTEEAAAQPHAARWLDYPRPTEFGGLLFLLPALAWLGVAEWLAANPVLIEMEFTHRLLRRVAQLFAVPDDDPILAALSAATQMPTPQRCEFIVPSRWIGSLAGGPLWLRHCARGAEEKPARVLTDGTGLLPLALWRGRAPLAVRALIGASPVQRGTAIAGDDDLEILLRAWTTALRRWCRRYAGISLRQLLRRPGRVLATRTHLDVLFDLNQAEMRIRRAGLDLNPGWLPWFGRVVTFHYLPGEQML